MLDKNKCLIEAKKYNSRIEFQRESQTIYNKSRELKILDDICKHMKLEIIDFDIQNIDLTFFSPKYSNKQNLFFIIKNNNNNKTYDIQFEIDNLLLKNIHINDIIRGNINHPNIEKYKINHRVKQFYHLVYEKAQRCKTKKEFRLHYPNEYDRAIKIYKNIDIICAHMPEVIHYWKFEEVFNESQKYNVLKDFYINSPKAYKAAIYNNWIEDVTKHMIKIPVKDLLHMVYAYEFSDNYVYVGLTRDLKTRIKIRKQDKNDCVNTHILKTNIIPNIIEISGYIDSEEAQELEISTIEKYKNNSWNILNRKIGGGLGGYK